MTGYDDAFNMRQILYFLIVSLLASYEPVVCPHSNLVPGSGAAAPQCVRHLFDYVDRVV